LISVAARNSELEGASVGRPDYLEQYGETIVKQKIMNAFVICAAALVPANVYAMLDWPNKSVAMLSSTYDGADCIYFTLQGVSEADPIKPGEPTFAIPRAQYGAKDAYAMLLAAKLSGSTVRVLTRGTLACGYASVAQIMMN
jgi:hypothetical protein